MTQGPQITVGGATRLVPVIGHPIVQARSPALFSALAAQENCDTLFVPMDIPPGGFSSAMRGFREIANLAGLVVTVPHKPAVLDFVDEASEAARLVGAANLVRIGPDGRWSADIKDGDGLVYGLRKAGVDPHGRSVQIVGSGGAGSAVAFALAQAGAGPIRLADAITAKAELLADRLARALPHGRFNVGLDLSGADIVVNASPVGMNGIGGTPFDPSLLRRDQVLAEMIMSPLETPLLAAARARGCKTLAGIETLNGQARAVMAFLGLSKGRTDHPSPSNP
ncbi:shikimate dehydrogenase [Defluviimonas sp. WL0002]|uniref:Shikimate dehydrogenase n=1 Tax=Albidovulum marisflavi TaxID=2984159 RepID=A0ABT2ZDU2_9RHOB|nr:shikimate dehydrogenase [Defluviimonas sp. WL0002]MCV2869297.1 shikimate dehydrogenase [Defluviimonas sp. WL0002]